MTVLPYGAWPSPITAADVAKGGVLLSFPGVVSTQKGSEVWWIEGRPEAAGRHALVRRDTSGSIADVLGPEWSPRSRIIEYGARPWCHVGAVTVFCFWDDQRLYSLSDDIEAPAPLTPAPPDGVHYMYGEPIAGPPGTVMAVRETHRDQVVSRDLVLIPLGGSAADDESAIHVLNDEHHFYANPRLSPDGQRVAYAAWDHPNMPWDSTVIAVAELSTTSTKERIVTGGGEESVLQPEWADDDNLYCVSDRSGWWNIYRLHLDDGSMTALCPREEEFGGPLWELGETFYAVLSSGQLAVTHGRGESALSLLSPSDGKLTDLGLGIGVYPELGASGMTVAAIATSDELPTSVITVDLTSEAPKLDVVRSSIEHLPDDAYLPRAGARTVTGRTGREIHTFIYPPKNRDVRAPDTDRPPYLVFVHGGPTAHVSPGLDLEKAYFTSRGIGVIDVNYGGSTGYGRAYRERLRGQWGVVDVEDCVDAALGVANAGNADRAKLGIRGGSAGGWTTLACLVQSDAFSAGAAYYPVTDLLPFASDTHDFESRYLDGLVGPLPESRDTYVERSPLSRLDNLRTAVLLLQGDDDKVVPPSQSEAVHHALNGSGTPHAYLLFAGEQHGFRKAESQIRALEAELSFFGQIFEFVPPGVPALALEY